MRMIGKIFNRDLRRVRRNIVALIVAIGMCLIPALYAWFNLTANWDPYGNTEGIKVAVATDDEGAQILNTHLNAGDEIIETLKSNKEIGWVFTNSKKAIKGVKAGDYYAAIVIPKNFTSELSSFLGDDFEQPQIDYYVNEKKNAIAPKITDQGMNILQKEVNATFISTVTETMVKYFDLSADALEEKGGSVVDMLLTSIRTINEDLDTYSKMADSLISTNEGLKGIFQAASSLTPGMNATIDQTQDEIKDLEASLDRIEGEIDALPSTGLGNIPAELDKLVNGMRKTLSYTSGMLQTTKSSLSGLDGVYDGMETAIVGASDTLKSTKELASSLKAKNEKLIEDVESTESDERLQKLMKIIKTDPKLYGDFMSSPVDINTTQYYEIENYGSAMSPFYSVLAIWVGAIVLVAIMNVRVDEDEEIKNIRPYQAYFGRYIIFMLFGQIQSLVICLGDLFFLKIQCENPFLFVLAGAVCSLVFTSIVYTLTVSFGAIGKALSVILLVVQIAGAGGTFPEEILPQFFQDTAPFFPFTYGINAMRETIGGIYENAYLIDILILLGFIIVVLALGLVLRRPFMKITLYFEKKLEESKLM